MIAEFTTLVGLIATFKQLRGGEDSKDEAVFRDWLTNHKFERISEQIAQSDLLTAELVELLRMDNSDILEKIKTIEDVVVSVSRKIDGLSGLAERFPDNEWLSDQAVMILLKLDETELGKAHFHNQYNECFLLLQPHGLGKIDPTEKRYFEEDLKNLLNFGFLAVSGHTQSGLPVIQISRAGSQAAKQLARTDQDSD
jgi:hypothetical protein